MIIFVKTKEHAEGVLKVIKRKTEGEKRILHSNKAQNTRINAIKAFKDGEIRILISTDVSARGLDASMVSHVINFDIPNNYDDYIHRIGRTAHAGNRGDAITLIEPSDEWHLEKIIPSDYKYPFGQGGFSIKSVRKKKTVLTKDEILKVIQLDKFESWKQEYARDIWMVLYYGSGINPIDLLRLRWKNVEANYIHLIRMKTEITRKSNIQELTLPLTDELRYYINKVGDPTSPFVLGKIKEGYSETTLFNRKNKFRQEINS